MLLKKYHEVITYLIVGVMTTIVSWCACFVATLFLDSSNEIQNFIINTIGWIAGVFFSYPLNRKWVFKSSNVKIIREFLKFAGSRVSTWILDVIIMWFFVNVYPLNTLLISIGNFINYDIPYENLNNLNYWVAKICISSVIVIILNYIFSKVFIFKNTKQNDIHHLS